MSYLILICIGVVRIYVVVWLICKGKVIVKSIIYKFYPIYFFRYFNINLIINNNYFDIVKFIKI